MLHEADAQDMKIVEIKEQRRRRAARDLTLGYNPKDARYYGGGWTIAPSFIILIAITAAAGYAVWNNQYGNLAAIAFLISSAIVTLCIHEFGHAVVAYVGGDKSVRAKGYLTLDVLKYADPISSVVLPMAFLFMGGIPLPGGAVYVNTYALRGRLWEVFVSAAGILFNVIALVPIVVLYHKHSELGGSELFWQVVSFLIYIEIAAILLNLLPIPSFDGFGILEPFLPRFVRSVLQSNTRIIHLIPFLVLLVPNPILSKVWEYTDRVNEMLNIEPVKSEIFDFKNVLDVSYIRSLLQSAIYSFDANLQNLGDNLNSGGSAILSGSIVQMCSERDVVKLAKEQAEEEVRTAFSAIDAFGALLRQKQTQIVVSVDLGDFREYRAFDRAIKKRFCEASALVKITGLSEMTQMGLALNGINPGILSGGIYETVKYTIQLTEDGTQLIGLEEESNLLGGTE